MFETSCVGDGLGHFDHEHPVSFYMSIEFQSPRSRCHQDHDATNITVTEFLANKQHAMAFSQYSI